MRRLLLPAAGLSPLVLVAILAAVPGRTAAQPLPAQPRFLNAKLETRVAGAEFGRVFSSIVAGAASPRWIGYSVPAVPGEHYMCDARYPSRAYLEGRPSWRERDDTPSADGEGSREILVLFRADAGKVQKVRVFGTDCELEAGGLPVTWLTGVSGVDSVKTLRGLVGVDANATRGDPPLSQSALTAIALHADPSAVQALQSFAAAGQPVPIRKRAAFWLGAARGSEGFDILRRLVAGEEDAAFRRELVFPVSLARRPEAVDLLLHLAREDGSPEVRKQAMFWLGQRAGEKAARALGEAIENDPDTAAKKQAVFGLSRMPNGEGIPRLIEVARANRNPEVRRQAMFWLGRSNDPRALAFLEEVLRKQ